MGNLELDRLEKWLKVMPVPRQARTCIRNAVSCCNNPDLDYLTGFMYIDIKDFTPQVQDRLVKGFIWAYYKLLPSVFHIESPEYTLNLN